ncbi:ATP binding protein, putative [Ricinus communis]|uniref:ATP binding protein, putative n=1 Tax=Ricinus communis TaxID=3988 RepID=B9SBX9_RICCO|nr:ATP binding protein, putative [Ricinus communis]
MEDDDEFGDLYTDVLRPFSSSLSSDPSPHHPSPASAPSIHRPIDLNLNNNDDVHDDEILTVSNSAQNNNSISAENNINNDSNNNNSVRVLSSSLDVKLQNNPPSNKGDLVDMQSDKQDKDISFDIEEEEEEENPIIPGLTVEADVNDKRRNEEAANVAGEDLEDEDSDSEDDLQIVLNDNGPTGMERGGGGGMIGGDEDDDDDDDDDPLVIVADGDANQAMMEEQDWGSVGEDAAAATGAEGERKEGGGETAGGKGGNVIAGPKIGYSNHVYHHPFHSQFKYVRPGAAPIPGATTAGPGGAPGQVRPPINMAPIAGRGRGDWRPAGMKNGPPMQKGYHPGFGMPWGNNMAGRGFGGGLEFTLPSHKTIFDVDIDSFEEKPWKYPGVDMSDFFNFGLNEESWKDYCKQLEQHRLETTMQSKIRVYESGRAEQEYDPDLPPELAAAAGMHDVPAENSNLGKSDVGQSDLTKGPARMRPPLPTGRAIQVEGGYGERLPSIDTRPPRTRDCDVIIEIVLQDSLDDDSSSGNGGLDGENGDPPSDDFRESHVHDDEMVQIETDHYDNDLSQGYDGRKDGRKAPVVDSGRINIPEGDGMLPFRHGSPSQNRPGSRGQRVSLSGGDFCPPDEESSPDSTPSQITRDKRFLDNVEEESVESMDGKHSPLVSSPTAVRDARDLSAEDKDVAVSGEPVLAEVSSGMERDEMNENEVTTKDSIKDGDVCHSTKKQKLNSHVGQSALQEVDDGEDSKAARSSENSKARSGSSKDYQKWQDSVEEEVMQDGRTRDSGTIKRPVEENESSIRRKERDVRQEMERNHMARKGREGSYPQRDLDTTLAHHPHVRNEGYDRHKERENPDGAWLRREEDQQSRKSRPEESRKRERGEEMASRHRSKIREGERSDKEEHLHSRKQLDNGNYRIHYDKDGSSRHREREDTLKIRYDIVDDYHSKRRKDEEYVRRDHTDKEEMLHGHRETTSRRRRERDEVLDPRKREDQQRVRDSLDDYHSVRHKDELWPQRERGDRQREREELYRLKQSHEENLSKREKEEGRGTARTGRGADDKAWINYARKDEFRGSEKEYQLKDAARNSEQQKRRDRVEDEGYSHHRARDDVYARTNQLNEERRSRQERSSIRIDRAVHTPDKQRVNDRKHKDNMRKNKESEGGDRSTLGPSKRNQEDQSGHTGEMGLKGSAEQGNGENMAMQRNSSKRHKEDASSDEEQQDSRRGRSKLERWTSHKERDYSINSKSSASLKFKEIDRNNNSGPLEANKPLEEQPEAIHAVEKHPLAEERDASNVENKDNDTKPLEDWHLDTVEKLKKRSERFKLPMPSEKDALVVKKMESEALPSVKTDTPVDLEIKPERPARKRRWISS